MNFTYTFFYGVHISLYRKFGKEIKMYSKLRADIQMQKFYNYRLLHVHSIARDVSLSKDIVHENIILGSWDRDMWVNFGKKSEGERETWWWSEGCSRS